MGLEKKLILGWLNFCQETKAELLILATGAARRWKWQVMVRLKSLAPKGEAIESTHRIPLPWKKTQIEVEKS